MTLPAFRTTQWNGVIRSERCSRMGVEEAGHDLVEASSWSRYGGLRATRRILSRVSNQLTHSGLYEIYL